MDATVRRLKKALGEKLGRQKKQQKKHTDRSKQRAGREPGVHSFRNPANRHLRASSDLYQLEVGGARPQSSAGQPPEA